MDYRKLINLQSQVRVAKNQYNSFGEYSYRSLEEIFEAVKPILTEIGVAIVVTDDLVLLGDRYYVKATASVIDDDGTVLASCTGFAREEKEKKKSDGSQLTGMASSYARKYALSALLCLDDVKDADAINTEEKTSVPAEGVKYDLRKLGDKDVVMKAVEFFKANGVEAVIGENNEIIVTLDKGHGKLQDRLKGCELK